MLILMNQTEDLSQQSQVQLLRKLHHLYQPLVEANLLLLHRKKLQ
jgi:hypothetical protein